MKNSILAVIVSGSLLFPATGTATDKAETIYDWGLRMISHWVPPQSVVSARHIDESVDEAINRYNSLISDAISVVYDENEEPLFRGDKARAKTLAVLLSTMRSESSFRRDVDFGEPPLGMGDGGRSWCLMQVRLSQADKEGNTRVKIHLTDDYYGYTFKGQSGFNKMGFGGQDLVSDRKICIRVGLHMLRESVRVCSRLPVEDRLSLYSMGTCYDPLGWEKSKNRMKRAMSWFKRNTPPLDSEVLVENSQTFALGG